MRTDAEPRPRERPLAWSDGFPDPASSHPLSREILAPDVAFLAVLAARVSAAARAAVPEVLLGSVLWHSMLLRERRPVGRFGLPWESRSAPSAGGLHPLRLLALPVGSGGIGGFYAPEAHALRRVVVDDREARRLNGESVRALTGAETGTTLQIVADPSKTAACYLDAEGLVHRDAGALAATVCLVATALGLASVPLGRAGTDVVRAAGLAAPFVGLGAVHLGGDDAAR